MNNEEYFSYLVQTYQKLIYTICFQTTKNQFDAQDLTQETFLSAYKNLDSFNRVHERAWLCRIASNKALDYLKSSQRKVVCEEDSFFLQKTDPRDGPEELYLQKEAKEQVYSICISLKEPYRETALAHFYHEQSAAQIADSQHENIKTVQTRIYRARQMIQKILKGGPAP